MTNYETGEYIWIKCNAQPGPFPGEMAIEFESVDGPVSGFVQEKELRKAGDDWLIHARVNEVHGSVLEVWVEGSFFSTNGLANINRDITMQMAA